MNLRKHWIYAIDLEISMLHFELGAYSEGYKGNWHYKRKEHVFY